MTRAEMDASSKEGAARIAEQIKSYWAKRGGLVKTYIEPFNVTPGNPKTHNIYCVRTDMVNGLPARWEDASA